MMGSNLTEEQTQDAMEVSFPSPSQRVQVQQQILGKTVRHSSVCVLQALVDGAADTQMAAFLVLLRAKASP